MKTAESFDGHDLAAFQSFDRAGHRILTDNPVPPAIPQLHLRSALPAGIGLGMKPAMQRVVVLRLACWTHRERRHGSVRPVVRDIALDGEARSAIGAIDKGILVAPVAWIEK